MALAAALEKQGFSGVTVEPKLVFTTLRRGLENDNNYLFELLKKNGFEHVSAERRRAPGKASCRCSF